MSKKNLIQIISISIITGIFFAFFMNEITNTNMSDVLNFILFNGINRPTPDEFLMVFMCILPYFALCYPLSSILSKDLEISAVYMFTRNNNRIKWYFKKIALVVLSTLLSMLLYFTTIILTLVLHGTKFNFKFTNFFYYFLIHFYFCFS